MIVWHFIMTAKISVFSLGKIYKYEYLRGQEKLPSQQHRLIEQAKFTYSAFVKTLGNK